jgi:hypothetical protein
MDLWGQSDLTREKDISTTKASENAISISAKKATALVVNQPNFVKVTHALQRKVI